ncbi:MAG: Nif3-like dinuclear metal center hexameric protein, partial [Clostridiales bacterium]|nr:Nif3-like dinuclear metal center hexameric protein [Clostridiales bacterium]
DFIDNAYDAKADVYITGDLKYHEAQKARLKGINIVDAGHFDTEQFFMEEFANILRREFERQSYDVVIINSKIDIDPFIYL